MCILRVVVGWGSPRCVRNNGDPLDRHLSTIHSEQLVSLESFLTKEESNKEHQEPNDSPDQEHKNSPQAHTRVACASKEIPGEATNYRENDHHLDEGGIPVTGRVCACSIGRSSHCSTDCVLVVSFPMNRMSPPLKQGVFLSTVYTASFASFVERLNIMKR